MPGCCDPHGCAATFTEGFARRVARRYRRRGLGRTARRMVNVIAEAGLVGTTVLEIGGGVGEIHLELLKRGAARATNLELSSAYEAEAQELVENAGYSDRVQRRILDIAAAPDEVDSADVVVLHRVVCCYPDYARLLAAVADHARRQVVFSHPPRNLVSRALFGAQNLFFRVQRSPFRVFTHPPAQMRAVLAERGLRCQALRAPVWQIVAGTR
jgi:magnesium-protoporphyrin O-methyltransferase